jgi:hypothetical protein
MSKKASNNQKKEKKKMVEEEEAEWAGCMHQGIRGTAINTRTYQKNDG